jgi:hypothetical protein
MRALREVGLDAYRRGGTRLLSRATAEAGQWVRVLQMVYSTRRMVTFVGGVEVGKSIAGRYRLRPGEPRLWGGWIVLTHAGCGDVKISPAKPGICLRILG